MLLPAGQIKKLANIVGIVSNRNNQFFTIFNIVFLLDYHFMIMLEGWKAESGSHLKDWLGVIGEVEALSSLSVIRYDYPEWAMPEFFGQAARL